MTLSGIEPATSWFVAQCLNQLRHLRESMGFRGHVLQVSVTLHVTQRHTLSSEDLSMLCHIFETHGSHLFTKFQFISMSLMFTGKQALIAVMRYVINLLLSSFWWSTSLLANV